MEVNSLADSGKRTTAGSGFTLLASPSGVRTEVFAIEDVPSLEDTLVTSRDRAGELESPLAAAVSFSDAVLLEFFATASFLCSPSELAEADGPPGD
jgi:hypothetical protein